MISVDQALSLVMEAKRSYGTSFLSLEESLGKILAQDIFTDRDYPPFDRVSMDGIAIAFNANTAHDHIYFSEGIQQAGKPALTLNNPTACFEAMTGAPLPIGCDTVIRYEDLTKHPYGFSINIAPSQGSNVHLQGADAKAKTKAIPKATTISPLTMGVLASLGVSKVEVLSTPKIAILSTGDELVPINTPPQPHQIRSSNAVVLNALLKKEGLHADCYHAGDSEELLNMMLRENLSSYEVILITGGVSAGKFDFVPSALSDIGVEPIFHKVAQKPGKPFWFGASKEQVIFGYPGNPMSCFVCHKIYFEHWWRSCRGKMTKKVQAKLGEDVTFRPNLSLFLLGVVESFDEQNVFKPLKTNGSGDFISPLRANAILHLPSYKELFLKGEHYDITHI